MSSAKVASIFMGNSQVARLALLALLLLVGLAGNVECGQKQQSQQQEAYEATSGRQNEADLYEDSSSSSSGASADDSGNNSDPFAGLTSFFTGGIAVSKSEPERAPLAAANTETSGPSSSYGPAPSALAKKEKHKQFGLHLIGDWLKLIFNPFELVKSICEHFKLPLDKFLDKIGKGVVFGVEAMLQPLVITIRIIERVFVPDHCRLRFMCRIGHHLDFIRDGVLKFSPSFLEGSSHIKALSDGIIGKECEAVFTNCEPKLKKEFVDLRVQPKEEQAVDIIQRGQSYKTSDETLKAKSKSYASVDALKTISAGGSGKIYSDQAIASKG